MPFDAKKAVGIIVTLFVAFLLAAFLMPTVIGAVVDDETATYNQSVGETVNLQGEYNATVDGIDTATDPNTVNYTIESANDSATASVQVDSNTTVTVGGTDIEIAPTEAGTDYAITDYTFDKTAGWGTSSALWYVIPLFLILPLFMLAVSKATDQL